MWSPARLKPRLQPISDFLKPVDYQLTSLWSFFLHLLWWPPQEESIYVHANPVLSGPDPALHYIDLFITSDLVVLPDISRWQ